MKLNEKGFSTIELVIVSFVLLFVFGIGFVGWKVKRYFNYEFEYKENIQQEIKKMVKKECLINQE